MIQPPRAGIAHVRVDAEIPAALPGGLLLIKCLERAAQPSPSGGGIDHERVHNEDFRIRRFKLPRRTGVYIDLYLIHWPNPSQGQFVEAWQALVDAHHALWGTERIGADEKAMSTRTGRPLTDKWTFSTNGVSIQGRYGIPCVGFGPGAESQAHAPNEITWKQDLVVCAALYAAVPMLYKPENKDGSATSFRQELTGNDIK